MERGNGGPLAMNRGRVGVSQRRGGLQGVDERGGSELPAVWIKVVES